VTSISALINMNRPRVGAGITENSNFLRGRNQSFQMRIAGKH
jgi:hypothetical protein